LGHKDWADEVDGLAAAARGDYDGAQKFFANLDKADDPFLRSLQPYVQACVLAEQGRNSEAIARLEESVGKDRANGDLSSVATKLLGLAHLYFRERNAEKGRENALAAVEAESSVSRLADAGTLLARNGFSADAQRFLRRIGDGSSIPDNPVIATRVAYHRLDGEILLAQKQCEQALNELDKAKTDDQEHALLHDYWAHGLLACGHRQEAADEYQKLRSRPTQAWHQPEFYPPGNSSKLLYQAAF
jgi:tetratricopeptide (TPR) repeat protein